MIHSGESGFKILVVLMILGLGFLGREYLVVQEKTYNLEQAYLACTNSSHSLESQAKAQSIRLQELENSAMQWEPILQTLQDQNQSLNQEYQAVLATTQELQSANESLSAQLEEAHAQLLSLQVERDQDLAQTEQMKNSDSNASSEQVAQTQDIERFDLRGFELDPWQLFVLAGAGIVGIGAVKVTSVRSRTDKAIILRVTRSEARMLARLRRRSAWIESGNI
jgi:hypothetical protein